MTSGKNLRLAEANKLDNFHGNCYRKFLGLPLVYYSIEGQTFDRFSIFLSRQFDVLIGLVFNLISTARMLFLHFDGTPNLSLLLSLA